MKPCATLSAPCLGHHFYLFCALKLVFAKLCAVNAETVPSNEAAIFQTARLVSNREKNAVFYSGFLED
jgi:hypothetical protein